MLLRSAFLRRQAESCLRISRDCSNPRQAEQWRLRALEFFRRAIENENDHRSRPPGVEDPHD